MSSNDGAQSNRWSSKSYINGYPCFSHLPPYGDLGHLQFRDVQFLGDYNNPKDLRLYACQTKEDGDKEAIIQQINILKEVCSIYNALVYTRLTQQYCNKLTKYHMFFLTSNHHMSIS
ncbi:hypothetical protein EV175_006597 [Coemansia sp. RSA 1933]|nr:hypothetical protein EV175_006597 [Coemansia sp. RSA 1933]